jgi:hypothetical protein
MKFVFLLRREEIGAISYLYIRQNYFYFDIFPKSSLTVKSDQKHCNYGGKCIFLAEGQGLGQDLLSYGYKISDRTIYV